MLRILFFLTLFGILSGCTLTNRAKLDGGSITPETQSSALIFQSDAKFASFLKENEKQKAKEFEQNALNFGKPSQPLNWTLGTDANGSVTAFQLFRVGDARCRKFRHLIFARNQQATGDATACQRGDGEWRLVR